MPEQSCDTSTHFWIAISIADDFGLGLAFALGFCDDDMVRYFLSQIEKERQARHTGNGELARNEQLRLIRLRTSVTYTVQQPGKGTRPYCNICLPPLQTPFGSSKQQLNTLDRTCHQNPLSSAWQSLMPKAVTAGVVSESSLRQERVPGCRSARN